MSAAKRPASNSFGSSQVVVKRQKSGSNLNGKDVAVTGGASGNGALIQAVPRTSGLQAPIMELTGHSGEVFACRFDKSGQYIASGSMDRSIMLWRTYGTCENYGILTGHRAAILDISWSQSGEYLFSGSADTTIASWDLETGTRIRKHEFHTEIVNSICVSPRGGELLVSGSDDGSIAMWDPRAKRPAGYIETDFPITAVAVAEAGNEIFTGGIDCEIKVWDVRRGGGSRKGGGGPTGQSGMEQPLYTLPGHTDTVTSLSLSPDSQTLLSYSHDSLLRTWDIKPFAPLDRSLKTYAGAPVGPERNLVRASWDREGRRVGVGSGDGSVCVWDRASAKLLYKLPGHRGTVNDVRFSPIEEAGGVLLSASSDRNLLLVAKAILKPQGNPGERKLERLSQ